MPDYLIGLDYGTESARGVLVDAASGHIVATHVHAYAHGVLAAALPDGTALPPGWALQNAPDYVVAAEVILATLGRGRIVRSIGVGFTASTVLPVRRDGLPLSVLHPANPHAYAKLWKHQAAQPYADRITAGGGAYLADYGGRLSANSLTARAAETADQAPGLWAEADRFIEAGDWLIWQMTGREVRSAAYAAFKAQYSAAAGYPADIVPGLAAKLGPPLPVGRPGGALSAPWRDRTGVQGDAIVAVGVIDAHVVMPAAGAVRPGTLVGALGTSACYLLLDDAVRPLPPGIEGVARDATLPGLRCFEAGQAGFGDVLAWFVRTFPRGSSAAASFAAYHAEASDRPAGASRLIALDWWSGCRVPHADALLSGLFVGMTLQTTAVDLYRALLESLCFGARVIVDLFAGAGAPIDDVIMTSGLSLNNVLLMQLMADVLGREIKVPQQAHLTALGAAIHGAVAAGLVPDFATGAARFGARTVRSYAPDRATAAAYDRLYGLYRELGAATPILQTMRTLASTGA